MERWFVTGSSGQLGGHVLDALVNDKQTKTLLAVSRTVVAGNTVQSKSMELSDFAALQLEIEQFRPTHVLHIGAMTAVSDCYQQSEHARIVNCDATAVLAQAAASLHARFIFISTDMVFAGNAAPYGESDRPAPLSHYGRTKRAAEELLADIPDSLTVRLPLLFGFPRTVRPATFASQIDALRTNRPLKLFTDEFRTPLWLPDAAVALLLLARSGETGIMHVAGPQRLSRYEMMVEAARALRIPRPKLEPISRLSIAAAEPRPADLSLNDERFRSRFPAAPRTSIGQALLKA